MRCNYKMDKHAILNIYKGQYKDLIRNILLHKSVIRTCGIITTISNVVCLAASTALGIEAMWNIIPSEYSPIVSVSLAFINVGATFLNHFPWFKKRVLKSRELLSSHIKWHVIYHIGARDYYLNDDIDTLTKVKKDFAE